MFLIITNTILSYKLTRIRLVKFMQLNISTSMFLSLSYLAYTTSLQLLITCLTQIYLCILILKVKL